MSFGGKNMKRDTEGIRKEKGRKGKEKVKLRCKGIKESKIRKKKCKKVMIGVKKQHAARGGNNIIFGVGDKYRFWTWAEEIVRFESRLQVDSLVSLPITTTTL
jgi:hypothetical protein